MPNEDDTKTNKDELAEAPSDAKSTEKTEGDAIAAEAKDAPEPENPFAPKPVTESADGEVKADARPDAVSDEPKDLPAKTEEELDDEAPLVLPDPPGPARWVPLAIAA